MSAHTPGPWTVKAEKVHSSGHIAGRGPDVLAAGGAICHVHSGQSQIDTAAANARLIAAAPDLLAALRGLYGLCPEGHLDDKRGLWADAWAAIAKAEGK